MGRRPTTQTPFAVLNPSGQRFDLGGITGLFPGIVRYYYGLNSEKDLSRWGDVVENENG